MYVCFRRILETAPVWCGDGVIAMARAEKYPWSTTAVGEAFRVPYDVGTAYALRTLAGYQEKRYGRFFSVETEGDELVVTRHAERVVRKPGRRDGRPWDRIGVGEFFDIMRTECSAQNVSNLVARRNTGQKKFHVQNLADRWRIRRYE